MQRALILGLVVIFEAAVISFLVTPREGAPPRPSITMTPAPASTPEHPAPLKEVPCDRSFGHGVSYKIDGVRHCFVEVESSPVPSPSA